MKLQKAIQTVTDYPTRKSIKPILLSATVAMALTACVPHTAGKMPNNTQESNCSTPVPNSVEQEVKPPENIAGGMPVFIPEENNQTWGQQPQK
jgi:hypothetical protein